VFNCHAALLNGRPRSRNPAGCCALS
jgi:hypothetical protein